MKNQTGCNNAIEEINAKIISLQKELERMKEFGIGGMQEHLEYMRRANDIDMLIREKEAIVKKMNQTSCCAIV